MYNASFINRSRIYTTDINKC